MKIFIVDDHQMIQLGMKNWIESNSDFKVVGTSCNIDETLKFLNQVEPENFPDILIIDVDLGKQNGLDLVRKIKQQNKNIKTLVYSMHKESGYLLDAKNCGADGYIAKDADMTEFKICLEKIASGSEYFDASITAKTEEIHEALKILTPKEQLVFQEILKEETNESIAQRLNVSVHTIEIYVSRIYDKLDVRFRRDLIEKYNKKE